MVFGQEKLLKSLYVVPFVSFLPKKNSRISGFLNFNQFNAEMLENVLLSQKCTWRIRMQLHIVFASSVGRPLELAMTKTVWLETLFIALKALCPIHMSIGHPPKNVRQVVFFKEQIRMTIINRREGGENTLRYSARHCSQSHCIYKSRLMKHNLNYRLVLGWLGILWLINLLYFW